jgi:nucleoside 2-deoxyribosyltransferase
MGRLNQAKIYLAGNIDHVEDLGIGWRDILTPFLKQELGMIVLNPCKKPRNLISNSNDNEDYDSRTKRKELKAAGKWQELHDEMNEIARADLHFVDISNVLIVGLDMDKRPCGTIWEICIANSLKKPVIIVCEGGKKNIPDWLYALLPWQLFFDTWDEVKNYLKSVDSDPTVETYGRWRLFDFNGDK